MSVLVKICGLRDGAAVAAAVEGGADAVGFVFAPSLREVTPAAAAALAAAVPENILRVAVMLHPQRERWEQVRELFRPDVLQTDADDFAALEVPARIRRWPVIREGADTRRLPEEFVYEGATSGQGNRVDWRLAAALAARGRMILAGGLHAGNVARAISEVAPYGVDVSSAVESSPGRKDPHKIRDFIDAARAASKDRN